MLTWHAESPSEASGPEAEDSAGAESSKGGEEGQGAAGEQPVVTSLGFVSDGASGDLGSSETAAAGAFPDPYRTACAALDSLVVSVSGFSLHPNRHHGANALAEKTCTRAGKDISVRNRLCCVGPG